MTRDQMIDRLMAREQMRDAVHTYCRAIDRGQPELLRLVFHDDAKIDCGVYQGDIAGFQQMLRDRQVRVQRSVHMIGNTLFDFLDEGRVFTESYCLALEEFLPEGEGRPGLNRLARVRYADDFEARAGVWKIVRRVIVVDHAMAPEAVGADGFFKGPAGGRDHDDFVMAHRAALGIID